MATELQFLGLAAPTQLGCLSIEHRCFTSTRARVLLRATRVLGSKARAIHWFVGQIPSLDKRQPCTMMMVTKDFNRVLEVLSCFEHGIF